MIKSIYIHFYKLQTSCSYFCIHPLYLYFMLSRNIHCIISFYFFIFLCVCTWMQVCTWHSVYVYVSADKLGGWSSLNIYCLVWYKVYVVQHFVYQVSWPRNFLGFLCLHLLSLHRIMEITDSCYHVQLYVDSVDTNSGTYNCALSTEPSL